MKIEVGAQPTVLIFQTSGQDVIAEYLKFNGFEVIETTEADVIQKIKETEYQICILDYYKEPYSLKLLDIARKVDENRPIIMVTTSMEYAHKIKAFREGADDYVTRPCNVEELVCRIKAILKRCKTDSRVIEPFYQLGDLRFDVEQQFLIRDKDFAISLFAKESKVLALLCAHRNEVVPTTLLLKKVWFDDNQFNKRSLDVFMCKLRKYLAFAPNIKIETVRGYGYILKDY